MKLTHVEVIAKLERLGLKFRRVVVSTEGRYTPEDAIWNYKDAIVHIPYIHPLVRNVPILNHKDSLTSVFVQKAFGLKFPLVLFDYEEAPFTQTAVTCIFGFVLVIFNACEEVRPGITRVTTNYNIGAMPFMSWLSPLVAWALRRNYKSLTETDIPLRERRGELRSWGYDFKVADYKSTENVGERNVLLTDKVAVPPPAEIALASIPESGGSLLWGRSDDFGLKLQRSGQEILVFPRMCQHEGACLDSARSRSNYLTCSWHGRAVKPLARIDLGRAERQEFVSAFHKLIYSDGRLSITPVKAA